MHDKSSISINITPGTIVKTIAIAVIIWLLFYIRDLVLVLLISIVIASAIEPITLFLKRFNIPRVISVIGTYLVFFLILFSLIYVFVPVLIDQVSAVLSTVPKGMSLDTLWNPLNDKTIPIKSTDSIASGLNQGKVLVQDISATVASQTKSTAPTMGIAEIIGNIRAEFSSFSDGFIKTVTVLFGGALSFALMVVISFYLAVQEDGIEKFLRLVLPINKEEYVIDLWRRSQKKIGLWMQGQMFLGLLVGIILYLALTIVGIQNALLLAFLAGFLEIIPIFGPILAAIPAIALGYVDGGISMAIVVTLIYLIVQQFENHLFYPLVVKKIIGLPPIVSILALIVGGEIAGFLGIILSIPVATVLLEFLEDFGKGKHIRSDSVNL
jgi:predicted PurR-regulated permease PerM